MKKFLLNLAMLILLVFAFSCDNSNGSVTETQKREIDYSVFKSRQDIFNFLNKNNYQKVVQRTKTEDYSPFINSLNDLNREYGTNLTITNFDKYQIDNVENATLFDYYTKGYITKQDYDIIKEFVNDVDASNFETAVSNMENTIENPNLSESDFQKYSLLLNTILVVNEYYSQRGIDIFSNSAYTNTMSRTPKEKWGCAVAIAANAVSTYGLTSCIVPGPQCWAAIAGKGLSLLGMYFSC